MIVNAIYISDHSCSVRRWDSRSGQVGASPMQLSRAHQRHTFQVESAECGYGWENTRAPGRVVQEVPNSVATTRQISCRKVKLGRMAATLCCTSTMMAMCRNLAR